MSSYDDMFNSGMLRVARTSSGLQRPKQWPKHVSAMRSHTSYSGQLAGDGHSPSFYSDFMTKRAHPHLAASTNPSYHAQHNPASFQARAMRARAIMHAASVRAHAARLRAMKKAPQNPGLNVTDARQWHWMDSRA
jgi:hypothetical protein